MHNPELSEDERVEQVEQSIPEWFRNYTGLNPDVVNVEEVRICDTDEFETIWRISLTFDVRIAVGVFHGALKEQFDDIDSLQRVDVNTGGNISVTAYNYHD